MIWLSIGLALGWLFTLWRFVRTKRELVRDLEYLSRRQQTTQAVDEFPLLFRTLAEALDAGVIVVDAKRIIRYCNPTAAKMFGMPIDEALQHSVITLLRDYHADTMITQSIQRAESEHMTLKPILSNRTIRIWSEPAVGTGGALLIARDLTQFSQLERARRDLVANVSHELRTPLTSIRLLIETLQTIPPPEIAQRMLGQVYTELQAVMHLVDELHELSRIESGRLVLQLVLTPVESLIAQVSNRIQPQIEQKQLELHTSIAPDLPSVYVDPERMSQVLLNLLHNAVKWTESGGHVTINARLGQRSELKGVFEPDHDSDLWVLVSVHDTGAGIPAADIGRIFERFYKVDRARTRMKGGSGLGLAIVKHLVECHKGTVWASSVEGRGSAFFVALPVLD